MVKMEYLSKSEIKNKRVLLRCDFNVPIKDNKIIDNSKILISLDTICYLLENNNTVIILSHFGRVKKEEDKDKNSLNLVYEELKKYIDIDFVSNPEKLEEVTNVTNKKCILVENTRFTDIPEKKESINDLDLAKYWASFGDVFVLDAFASLHRSHSSTAGISKYLPTYLGFLVESELNNLNVLIENKDHPFTVIMGGAKVDDKIKIIESLLKKCDNLVLTGGILNTFLKVKGINVGNSLVSTDEDVLNSVKRILDDYADKIIFTNYFVVKRGNDNLIIDYSKIQIKDIILDNLVTCKEVINSSKIIFLNGTSGKYEDKNYEKGTIDLLNILKNSPAKVIIGGGDTVSAVNKFNYENDFTYLSSGGGATLEYVAFGKLKALEWIKENGIEN